VKRIKLFEEFLNEMEIGNTLFSRNAEQKGWEENTINKKYLMNLVSSMKDKNELNTSDEIKFLKFIENYVYAPHLYKGKLDADLFKDIKDLQKLKKKFPLILDPTKEVEKHRYAYRGASIQTDELEKLIKKAKFINETEVYGNPAYYVKVDGTVTTRSDKNFISFTTKYLLATRFYIKSQNRNMDNWRERSECILEVPINSPNLLFNPDFINMFSNFNEYETWYINKSNEIDISGIYISAEIYEYLKEKGKI